MSQHLVKHGQVLGLGPPKHTLLSIVLVGMVIFRKVTSFFLLWKSLSRLVVGSPLNLAPERWMGDANR